MYTQQEIDHLANSKYQYHIGKISENVIALRELTLKLKKVGKQEDLIKLNDLMNQLRDEYTETLQYFTNIEEDSYLTPYRDLIFEVTDRIPNREKVLKLEQELFLSSYQKAASTFEKGKNLFEGNKFFKEDDIIKEEDLLEEDGSKTEKKEKVKKEGLLDRFYSFFDKIFG